LLSSPIDTLAFDSLDGDLGSCSISVKLDSWSTSLSGILGKRLVKQKGSIGDFKVDISKAKIDEDHVYISTNCLDGGGGN